jgi:ABC-type branched-subunit amino acid transport system ATPase component
VTSLLSVEAIEHAYDRLRVLFGVSFDVREGEALALTGTNGAGKSTILKVVAGLEQPTAGRVRLGGEDITGRRAEDLVRRGLVLVQGGRGVFPDMSVAENLEIVSLSVRRRRTWCAERRELALATFPALKRRWGEPAATLSGGEQQQLALAKALLLEPRVLCIDELSLGLAPIVVDVLIEAVSALRAAGVTMVVVEQSLTVASCICERAVFIEKGEVRFEGQLRELIERDDLARAVFFGAPPQRSRTRKAAPRGDKR